MRLARGIAVGVLALGLPGSAFAQDSARTLEKFVGSWKEDQSKSVLPPTFRNPLRFTVNRDGVLEESRGPEQDPTVQPVRFDGKPQALPGGSTSTWKQFDGNTFEQVRADANGSVRTRRLTTSTDNKTLTEATEIQANGRTASTTKALYRRASAGDGGLVGRWESVSIEASALDQKIELAGPNTLRFSSSYSTAYELILDGEPRQVFGSATPALRATTASGRLLLDNSLEVRQFRNGTDWGRSVSVISADGKTITDTVWNVGAGGTTAKPAVFVWVKE